VNRRLAIGGFSLALLALAARVAAGQDAPTLLTRVTNAYPSYSPDGAKIAYMSNADGDFDIYVMEPDSGTIVKRDHAETRFDLQRHYIEGVTAGSVKG